MNERKIKGMEEREMWWMVVAAKTRELLSVLLLLPWISLYRLQLDLDFICSVVEIFYLYLTIFAILTKI